MMAAKAVRIGWRERFARWALRRHGSDTRTVLGQHNVYVLPSLAGLLFAALLLVLLLGSINYQLNLGYALTFLLAGSALSSLHLTHRNLRAIALHAIDHPQALFAARAGALAVQVDPGPRARWGVQLGIDGGEAAAIDPTAATPLVCSVRWVPQRRGVQPWPRLRVQTRWPLGLWRAWSVWQPPLQAWVSPTPEHDAPPLPPARAIGHGAVAAGDELDTLRPWQPGDAPRRVVWRKSAHGPLIVRAATPAALEHWLDWDDLALAPEARLRRLCAWVLAADRAQLRYGLRLPGQLLEPAAGDAQRLRCLRALAQHPQNAMDRR